MNAILKNAIGMTIFGIALAGCEPEEEALGLASSAEAELENQCSSRGGTPESLGVVVVGSTFNFDHEVNVIVSCFDGDLTQGDANSVCASVHDEINKVYVANPSDFREWTNLGVMNADAISITCASFFEEGGSTYAIESNLLF